MIQCCVIQGLQEFVKGSVLGFETNPFPPSSDFGAARAVKNFSTRFGNGRVKDWE